MITSKTVSPDIKQLLINGLIQDQIIEQTENSSETTDPTFHNSPVAESSVTASRTLSDITTTQSSVQKGHLTSSQSSTRKRCHDVPDSQEDTSGSNFKVWKDNEEKLLIDKRHMKDGYFRSSRNHTEIWKEIADTLNTTLNSHVTYQQCMYKYNSLKKKWKEVIDLPSGSEPKQFSHREEFDQFYGTKASTKPKHTLDTDNPDGTGNKEKEAPNMPKPKKPKKTPQKNDVSTLLEKQHTEFLNTMTKMHDEKMEKFDKFLEVFSNLKNNNNP